jgi:hypothetical protein
MVGECKTHFFCKGISVSFLLARHFNPAEVNKFEMFKMIAMSNNINPLQENIHILYFTAGMNMQVADP